MKSRCFMILQNQMAIPNVLFLGKSFLVMLYKYINSNMHATGLALKPYNIVY